MDNNNVTRLINAFDSIADKINQTPSNFNTNNLQITGDIKIGNNLQSNNSNQIVQGQYNKPGNYAYILGQGNENIYKNKCTLDWQGNVWFAGDVSVGETNEKLITQNDINNIFSQKADINNAIFTSSISMGRSTTGDIGENSVALGSYASATAANAFSAGVSTKATEACAHAEGSSTEANGLASHAEGASAKANGPAAHAEGSSTEANGLASHAEGIFTKTNQVGQHVEGMYNIIEDVPTQNGYAHILGNGQTDELRSNAHTIRWDGSAWFAKDIKIGGNDDKDEQAKLVATTNYVDEKLVDTKNYVDEKNENNNLIIQQSILQNFNNLNLINLCQTILIESDIHINNNGTLIEYDTRNPIDFYYTTIQKDNLTEFASIINENFTQEHYDNNNYNLYINTINKKLIIDSQKLGDLWYAIYRSEPTEDNNTPIWALYYNVTFQGNNLKFQKINNSENCFIVFLSKQNPQNITICSDEEIENTNISFFTSPLENQIRTIITQILNEQN